MATSVKTGSRQAIAIWSGDRPSREFSGIHKWASFDDEIDWRGG